MALIAPNLVTTTNGSDVEPIQLIFVTKPAAPGAFGKVDDLIYRRLIHRPALLAGNKP
jgi:hypothetical protein